MITSNQFYAKKTKQQPVSCGGGVCQFQKRKGGGIFMTRKESPVKSETSNSGDRKSKVRLLWHVNKELKNVKKPEKTIARVAFCGCLRSIGLVSVSSVSSVSRVCSFGISDFRRTQMVWLLIDGSSDCLCLYLSPFLSIIRFWIFLFIYIFFLKFKALFLSFSLPFLHGGFLSLQLPLLSLPLCLFSSAAGWVKRKLFGSDPQGAENLSPSILPDSDIFSLCLCLSFLLLFTNMSL